MMQDDNHYVTVEEFEALVGAARKRKGGGFVRFIGDVCQMLLLAGAIFGGYVLIELFIGAPAALPPAQGTPALPPTAPYQTNSRPQPYTTSGGASTYSAAPLPSCADVTDTRTACQQTDQSAPAQAEAQTTPAPMQLAPAAVECYQGSFYTCEELAEMGDSGAVEAVKSTDAFVDMQTLPTAEPAFVDYATQACASAAVKSPLCP